MPIHSARYYPSGYGKYVELLSEEISFNDLQRLLSIDEVKLIDVRTPKEIQEHGKIEGSTNIPSKFICKKLNDLSFYTY